MDRWRHAPLPDLVWLRDNEERTALISGGWRKSPAAFGPSFYAPRFHRHDSGAPWLCGEPISWPEPPFRELPRLIKRRLADPELFSATHSEILRGIRESRFAKVVPFVGEELEFTAPLHWSMWPAAFRDPGVQFAFGFHTGTDGMCGITPELLFSVRDGKLNTMALAGTGPLDGPPLTDDPKECLEHNIVVDHLAHALRGLGDLSVGSTVERFLPHLKHLYTPISVKLNEQPAFLDLVARLHPTAALGGWPREAALDFLRSRGGERFRFGAPFGYVNGDQMKCVVAIRCIQWSGERACLMSGCGVVKGSLPDREWREMELKRRSTARQLELRL